MRDKRYGTGPTTVHLILIFNSPLSEELRQTIYVKKLTSVFFSSSS